MIDIYPPSRPKTKKPGRTFNFSRTIWYLLGIIILFSGVYFGLNFVSQRIDTWLELEPLAVAENESSDETSENLAEDDSSKIISEEVTPENNQPSDNQTQNQLAENTPSQPLDQTAVPSQEPAANSFKIRILNGNAIWGAANKLSDLLTEKGFQVVGVGNAEKQNYQTSFIYYKSGKNAEADLVKKTLEANYSFTVEENSSLAGENDLLIVIGKK